MSKSDRKVVLWLPLQADGNIIYDGTGDPVFYCDPDYAQEFIKMVTTRYCNDLLTYGRRKGEDTLWE